ncbi:Hint domain-containing protein [Gluconobacter sp. P1D12_c]|uniref:Hint domain-containing protein n=1 Tax=Gluconobacter sp. P1D12_c TaxID=2762614 RepID=UPI00207B5886|nr:Hint domain-containing protein [Gluconobacter sp. P1D12_c]
MSQIVSSGQAVSGGSVSGEGNILTVENGGSIQRVTIVSGGAVSNEGEDRFLTISNGGTLTVGSAGTSYNATVLSGGLQAVTNGGHAYNVAVSSGGMQVTSSGGQLTHTQLNPGAALSALSGSIVDHAEVRSGASFYVASGAVADTTVISSGAVLTLQSGGILTETILSSGGRIDLDGLSYSDGETATFVSSGGAYYLNVTSGGNVVYSTRMQGDYSSNGVTLTKDDDGSTIAELGPVCFLGGSLIQTPTGEVAVEDLRAGDEVVVIRDGTEQVERLNWVGRKKAQVRKGPHLDEAGYPVRICKGAVSKRVPHTDLLLTPEHCLYLNGVFIPVRMLVNGSSITYATDITSYDYYHVETASHDVIVANGLTTESYLDTGNRNSFAQPGSIAHFSTVVKSWEHDASAPLVTDRAVVEPVHARLAQRSEQLGLNVASEPETTSVHNLHLETRLGQRIAPMRQVGGRLLFSLPTGTRTVRLVSRASRLCDSVGPYLDDRRMLGVLTRTIRLWDGDGMQELMARQPADAEGWYPADPSGIRWTNGNALLELGARSATDAGVLEIEILEAGPYVKPQTTEKRISLLCA